MAETLKDWLKWAKTQVDALDAELIAVSVFGGRNQDRSWLVAHEDLELAAFTKKQGNRLVKRRAQGEPLAYLLHKREFYGRDFVLNSEVLIPRPETETLIDLIKELDLPKRPRFLEIGTGSGCIAITLALEFPQAEVLATDISADALEVAERNDRIYEGRVEFIKSDLLKDVDFGFDGEFDVIVANLPYVNPNWEWLDQKALSFEPVTALFAIGENGLALYRRLFEELEDRKKESGVNFAVIEADPCQQDELIQLAEGFGWNLWKERGFGLVFSRDIRRA